MNKIAFMLTLGLVSFGCGSNAPEVKNTSNTANATNVAGNTQTQSAPAEIPVFTGGANPKNDVISSTKKLQEQKSWSATISSETNPALNAEMEYVAPDRYHIKKADGEVIVIGNDSYMNENGKWEKIEENIGEFIKSMTQNATVEAMESLKDVQIVGKEKFNGKDATVYSHKIDEVTTKVWIANESGLQLKNEIEVNIEGKINKQTTVYNYDKPIAIEAPKID